MYRENGFSEIMSEAGNNRDPFTSTLGASFSSDSSLGQPMVS